MFDISKLETDLSAEEGIRYSRYKDSRGIWTIGIGHNLQASPLPSDWKEPLSQAQVDQLFNQDISGVLIGLDRRLPSWRNYPEPVSRSLADMAFNLGVEGLMGFTTFLRLIREGRYAEAANDLNGTLWARQVKSRATRIEANIRSVA